MAIISLTIMPFTGERTVAYNYVRTQFGWSFEEFSQYSAITSAAFIIGN